MRSFLTVFLIALSFLSCSKEDWRNKVVGNYEFSVNKYEESNFESRHIPAIFVDSIEIYQGSVIETDDNTILINYTTPKDHNNASYPGSIEITQKEFEQRYFVLNGVQNQFVFDEEKEELFFRNEQPKVDVWHYIHEVHGVKID